jgi:hypothetical protein
LDEPRSFNPERSNDRTLLSIACWRVRASGRSLDHIAGDDIMSRVGVADDDDVVALGRARRELDAILYVGGIQESDLADRHGADVAGRRFHTGAITATAATRGGKKDCKRDNSLIHTDS